MNEAAQTLDVHTARIVDLYFDLNLVLRRFHQSRLNVAFATLFRVATSRMSASIVAYIAITVMARQFLDNCRYDFTNFILGVDKAPCVFEFCDCVVQAANVSP